MVSEELKRYNVLERVDPVSVDDRARAVAVVKRHLGDDCDDVLAALGLASVKVESKHS